MNTLMFALFCWVVGYCAGRADLFDLGRWRWRRDRIVRRPVRGTVESGQVVRLLRVAQERDGTFVPEPPEAA